MMAQFWTAVRTNAVYELEFSLCSSGGSARWVTAEGLIERDRHGRPVRVHGITRDVTERKQAEQGLQESERKLRELLGALPAAIHTTDTAGRITFCNKAAIDLWGVKPRARQRQVFRSWSIVLSGWHLDASRCMSHQTLLDGTAERFRGERHSLNGPTEGGFPSSHILCP